MTRANPLAMPLFDAAAPDTDQLAASGLPVRAIERIIYDVIAPHRGHGNPISIEKLGQITGFTDRTIKGAVADLVVDHKILIGASRQEPIGYFIVETDEDRAIAAEPYRSQVLQMLRRLRVLDGKKQVREWLGQLQLAAEGAE